MKAIGITCGIGSMLVGARFAGFDIVGNVEWRKYYHQKDEEGRNTFLANFPGAVFKHRVEDFTEEELAAFQGADIALGHPECGNFSQMNNSNNTWRQKLRDPADIPLFVDLVARFKPRFFVMDDLPKSFIAFSMEEYAKRLPDYDLFPEWVSNYGYGNIQKNRNRMFMIGALKTEGFAFRPGEFDHEMTVAQVIGDLVEAGTPGVPNHEEHVLDVPAAKGQHLTRRGERATWRQVADWFDGRGGGCVIQYVAEGGEVKTRPGTYLGHWEGHAHVMDGGSPAIHAIRRLPYTVRERARIQGFPDDFVFYGTKLEPDGTWNHDKNLHMVKQTGKAMPIQFCHYVSEQVAAHIQGKPFQSSGERIAKPNSFVDDAKRWYCENVGYAEQEKACDNCWLYDRCAIRYLQYGIGPEPGRRLSEDEEPSAPKPRKPRQMRRQPITVRRYQELSQGEGAIRTFEGDSEE